MGKDTAAKKVARHENDGWSIRDTAAEAGCSDTPAHRVWGSK
jgi:hypothetical protein